MHRRSRAPTSPSRRAQPLSPKPSASVPPRRQENSQACRRARSAAEMGRHPPAGQLWPGVQCFAKCPFTCQFDWLSDQLCQSLDRLSDHFAKHWPRASQREGPNGRRIAHTRCSSALRSARLPVNLIGSPINYANRLIGSPITSQSTDCAPSVPGPHTYSRDAPHPSLLRGASPGRRSGRRLR